MRDIDKIRDQFDALPYYNAPLADSPKENYHSLYLHNMVTAFYRRDQKVIDAKGKVILDAGCGSGYKSLILAEANPGAKVVGIDISEKSVEIARDRLKFHGFDQAEFYVSALEEIPQLGLTFDYINCDEVLYLLPDILQGLKSLKAVLNSDGILRFNLHSAIHRQPYFRAQEAWKKLGLMDQSPQANECQMVREVMKNLKDHIFLKMVAWKPEFENFDELLRSNHLLVGDQGFTIAEIFEFLETSNLEFISMINWTEWDLLSLFKNWDELPIDLVMKLSEFSLAEQLRFHELLHSGQRLLDLWCGHPQGDRQIIPPAEWTEQRWQQAQAHFHPQLRTAKFKAEAIAAITEVRSINLNDYLPINPGLTWWIDSKAIGLLLPLIDGSQSFSSLATRWQNLHPLDPITGEAINPPQAIQQVQLMLISLYEQGYLLLES